MTQSITTTPKTALNPHPPALFLGTDAISMNSPKLMGRQSAGNGFIRAFTESFSNYDGDLQLLAPNPQDGQAVADSLRGTGWKKGIQQLSIQQPNHWRGFDVLNYPSPFNDTLAWQRTRHGETHFALCGVTHTISSAEVMKQLANYVHGPYTPWDALICTSKSVLTAVHGIWETQTEFLSRRLGQTLKPAMPMTPVIPLGVHTDDFVFNTEQRIAGRTRFGFDPDSIVVLFVGRLSLHAKANPLPMYLACARAQKASGKKIEVLECGWFANDAIKSAFEDAARVAGIHVTCVDGRAEGVTKQAYASSDVFMSLSDNIQETFGLTPIEAMAAGLPVIVSDWDGYRETVRDGIDGFCIPTRLPNEPSCASEVIEGYESGLLNYDRYVAYMHMLTSIDVTACEQALTRLAQSPDLRMQMGAAGRARARERFDWSKVIVEYRALWTEQSDLLAHARQSSTSSRLPTIPPNMPNPLDMFAHYASEPLSMQTLLWRDTQAMADNEANALKQLTAIRQLGMWHFSGPWLPPVEVCQKAWLALPELAQSGVALTDWAKQLGMNSTVALRVAAWLHKCGCIVVKN